MAIQKLNTARGTRHIRIKDDGKTVFISKDEYDERRKSGETVKRARSTDGNASGSKSSSGSKSGRSNSSSGSKSGRSKSGRSKSSGSRESSKDDGFFASLFANMR